MLCLTMPGGGTAAPRPAGTLRQQLPRHHDALDLVGALVDLGVVGRGLW